MNAPPGTAGVLLDARYRLGPALADGGMSTVHSGIDTRLDRPVAIKIMDPRMAGDPVYRARFEREARSAARIDHPNVVHVYDQGITRTLGGEPTMFLVMELVTGGTLRDVLRARGALGVPAAVAVLEHVLGGLAEAHRLGMVHRDVKPENVLLGGGIAKVADFGLVTAAAQAGVSHAGMILGTMAYLSPEQVTTGQADPRSDVYSAGVLLYELLTGVPPYRGDNPLSVAYRHVNDDVPAPSAITAEVPPELDALVRRATSRDPAGRPADAAAFLAELRALRQRLEIPAVPVPTLPPPPVDQQHTLPAGAGPRATRALPAGDRPSSPLAGPAGHRAAHRRGRRLHPLWIAIALVLALAGGSTAWWLGSGRWTAMPSVIGLDRAAAERLLAEADLVVSVSEEFQDDVPADIVAASEPAPEARLLRGSAVRLVVSTGRPVVPALAPGTAVAAAEQVIRDASLTPVRSTSAVEFSDDVPEGAVVRSDPVAGTPLPIGGSVTLVLSKGKEPPRQVSVPWVIGESVDDAREILADAGFAVEVDRAFPFGRRNNGQVVGQEPSAGTTAVRGSTVTLRVF